MKKLLLATLLASTALSVSAKEITFAMAPTYPPFEFTTEKGEIVGFDVDIANAICAELQAKCSFKGQAFDSLIAGLKSKHFDAAISGMDITEVRAKQVSFSEPYYDGSVSYLGLKGKTDLASTKKVGVQNGTTFQQYMVNEVKQYQAVPYPNLESAMLDLKNGRIDLLFGDTAVLVNMIEKDPELAFVGDKVSNKKYFGNGMGIAVNKASKDLLAELNKGLAAIKANGEYQKIYDKWMNK